MAFTFHANTLAFGGQINEGRATKYLPSQASVALPPSGGFGESAVTSYNQEGISFDRAESRVLGSTFDDGASKTYTTYANVSVLNLDIDGRIQALALTSGVKSVNTREGECTSESRISFDANIAGLVIDGVMIDITFDLETFSRHGTFDEFVNSFRSLNEEEMTARAEAYNWPIEECRDVEDVDGRRVVKYHVPRRCTTGIRASLLRSTKPRLAPGEIPGITRRGFTIEVDGFGLIHLGEVLLKAGRRRINLLRVERGKSFDGGPSNRVSLPATGGEPRLRAIAMTETNPEPASLTSGGSGGGYTFCSGEGNGTDFLP